MNEYIQVLNTYLEENPPEAPGCGMTGLLDRLYCCYDQQKRGDSEQIKSCYQKLDAAVQKLPLEEQDNITHIACSLSIVTQREGFTNGVLTGFHLFRELTNVGTGLPDSP